MLVFDVKNVMCAGGQKSKGLLGSFTVLTGTQWV